MAGKKKGKRRCARGYIGEEAFKEVKRGKNVPKELKDIIKSKPGVKMRFSGASRISEYREEVDQVLGAIGVEAFVSDESTIGDFDPALEDGVEGLSRQLSIPMLPDDLVWKVAKRIRGRNQSN